MCASEASFQGEFIASQHLFPEWIDTADVITRTCPHSTVTLEISPLLLNTTTTSSSGAFITEGITRRHAYIHHQIMTVLLRHELPNEAYRPSQYPPVGTGCKIHTNDYPMSCSCGCRVSPAAQNRPISTCLTDADCPRLLSDRPSSAHVFITLRPISFHSPSDEFNDHNSLETRHCIYVYGGGIFASGFWKIEPRQRSLSRSTQYCSL